MYLYCNNRVFCPGYLEWWLDSNVHLVLFIHYIHVLNTISIAYMYMYMYVLSEWWLIHAEWWLFHTSANRCGQNTVYVHVHVYVIGLRS